MVRLWCAGVALPGAPKPDYRSLRYFRITRIEAVFVTAAYLAEMLTDAFLFVALVATAKVADVLPAGTRTLAGTGATD